MRPTVILKNYKHIPGGSCIATALSGIYRYSGFNLSEQAIIGIGSGIFFGYIVDMQTKKWRVELLSSQLIDSLVSHTGAFYNKFQPSCSELAIETVLKCINNGNPIAVIINPRYSTSLSRLSPQHHFMHFPLHMIVVYGYCKVKKEIYYYDTSEFKSYQINFSQFIRSRQGGNPDPMNTFYVFQLPQTIFPIEVSAKLALSQTVHFYKYSNNNLGLKVGVHAMERFVRQIRNWNNNFKDEDIADNALRFLISITFGGGVKDAFRNHYALFIRELSQHFGNNHLAEVASLFNRSSREWVRVREILASISQNPRDRLLLEGESPLFESLNAIHRFEKDSMDLIEDRKSVV